MPEIVLLAGGCALGGVARVWLAGLVSRHFRQAFPWGTLAVNGTGAFAVGLLAAGAAAGQAWLADPTGWRTLVVGFLGSYTTVSSFSLQTLTLLQEGALFRGCANIVLSLALCLSAAAVGLLAGGLLPWAGWTP